MREIEDIREELHACDMEIAALLTRRMDYIREIIEYKRVHGTPIFQPAQEEKQRQALAEVYAGTAYEREKASVFEQITEMSKRVQARALLPYNIALIGFMGAGKSTVASYLRQMLAMDLMETDALIVEREGMPITEIFAKRGEAYFRDLESRIVLETQERELTIISCGGGLVMRPENVRNLKKSSRIVLLTARPETIYERVRHSGERPILNGHMNVEYIAGLMEKRRAAYENAADLIIETDGKDVQEICEELIRRIHP